MNKKSLENRVSSISDKLEERIEYVDSKFEESFRGQTLCNNHFLNRICEVETNANFRSNQTNRELAVTQYIIAIVLFCIFLISLIGDSISKQRIIELQKEVAELQTAIQQLKGIKITNDLEK